MFFSTSFVSSRCNMRRHPKISIRFVSLRFRSVRSHVCRPYSVQNRNPCSSKLQPYELTYLLTYLLTPWCRVFPEQLTGLQLVKKFPAFHGTRRYITALTSVRHLFLSWASPIQSIYSHPTSWRSSLILSTHLRLGLPSGLFPSVFPTKTLHTLLSSEEILKSQSRG